MANAVVVRTHKFMNNRLLMRKQMVVDVLHPGLAGVSKKDLAEKIAKMYSVSDNKTIFLYGFRPKFGGGRSTGFALIYDNVAAATKYGSKVMLWRNEFAKKPEGGRKQRKERKNRSKKYSGKDKTIVLTGKGTVKPKRKQKEE